MNWTRGFVVVRDLLSGDECDALAAALPASGSRRGGIRDLLGVAAVRTLLTSAAVLDIAGDATPMSATLFDKTPSANWIVSWHQDRTPAAILAIRLHLDDCDETNGPLRVIPGSHRAGVVAESAIRDLIGASESITLTAKKGAAIVMRPLLLHASSKATSPAHRRVLHVEFR